MDFWTSPDLVILGWLMFWIFLALVIFELFIQLLTWLPEVLSFPFDETKEDDHHECC